MLNLHKIQWSYSWNSS